MKKHLTFLLCLALFCVAISGCGDNKAATDFSSFKVSGYEEAPKEIYSASAMDNNLGDTLMFADGTAKKRSPTEDLTAFCFPPIMAIFY